MTDLTALEEAAKKATQFSNGPWRWHKPERDHPRGTILVSDQLEEVGDGWVRAILYAEECEGGKAKIEGDDYAMEFIALANPPAILSLISTIRDLERERDEALNLLKSTIAPMSAYPSDGPNAQEVHRRCDRIEAFLAAAIRAEAKGSGG